MTHAELVRRAERWLRGRGCGVVFAELVSSATEIPDAIGWYNQRFSTLVECKVSRSDFYADKHKPHRVNPLAGMGRFRYYLAPAGVLTPDLVRAHRPGWGLVEAHAKSCRTKLEAEQFPLEVAWREFPMLLSYIRRVQQYGLTLDEVQHVLFVESERRRTEKQTA